MMTSEGTRTRRPKRARKQEEADMNLKKRLLGLSGIPITVTGFGAWALGGGGWAYGWGPQDDEESIRKECEASLRRLGVERIDLYQFHWPDETGRSVEDSWGEMVRLIEQGKVRMAGV